MHSRGLFISIEKIVKTLSDGKQLRKNDEEKLRRLLDR